MKIKSLILLTIAALLVIITGCEMNTSTSADLADGENVVRGFDGEVVRAGGVLYTGFRSSSYGVTKPYWWDSPVKTMSFLSPNTWTNILDGGGLIAKGINDVYPVSNNVMVWIVGRLDNKGEVGAASNNGIIMEMSGTDSGRIRYIPQTYDHKDYLAKFSEAGKKVIIQLEPGMCTIAEKKAIIQDLWDRYSGYNCVLGIGIDAEWNNVVWIDDPTSSDPKKGHYTVGDMDGYEAAELYNYMFDNTGWGYFYTKHWLTEDLPKISELVSAGLSNGKISNFIFSCDAQDNGSLQAFQDTMIQFAGAYNNVTANNGIKVTCPVLFQIGYHSDWWTFMPDSEYAKGADVNLANPPWFNTLKLSWNPNNDTQGSLNSVGGIPRNLNDRLDLFENLASALNTAHQNAPSTIINDKSQICGIIWVDFTLRRLFAAGTTYDDADNFIALYERASTIVQNGTFDKGNPSTDPTVSGANFKLAHWAFDVSDDAAATISVVNNRAKIIVTDLGTNSYDIALGQAGLNIPQSSSINIQFSARSLGANRSIQLNLGYWDGVGIWIHYGEVKVDLTSTMTTFTKTISLDSGKIKAGPCSKLAIDIGKIDSTTPTVGIEIDSISLY